MRHSNERSWLALLATLLGVASCGGSEGGVPTGPGPTPTTLTVFPPAVSLRALDVEVNFSATVLDQNGEQLAGVSITWTSADTTIATVSAAGRVRAIRPGATTVIAQSGGLTDDATVSVDTDELPVFPEGGTITSQDGLVTLAFPPDAVSGRVIVGMEPATGVPASPRMVGGSAVNLTPDGAQFAVPVTMTVQYQSASVPQGADEGLLRIHRLNGSEWSEIPSGSVDLGNRLVSAPIQGFSIYAVLVTPQGAPVHSVTVTPASETILIGNSLDLDAVVKNVEGTVLEGRTVGWTSSDPVLFQNSAKNQGPTLAGDCRSRRAAAVVRWASHRPNMETGRGPDLVGNPRSHAPRS